MANYKEIVTKAVISKGKKLFTTNHSIAVTNPSTILGCWVINHNFNGILVDGKIVIDGSYDVNIWYSSDNDTKTLVVTDTNTYHEVINMREHEEGVDEEIIVRSLKQPSCVKVDIDGNNINYTIEKELGIDIDIYNPYDNILAGTYWLSRYAAKYPDDVCMQLQCYNMGEANAKKNKNNTTYYNKILSYYLKI